ncbi:MAG: NusG domain II-containing protein [Sterolibacterium sp.]|nr:NusG domain II-containing protein [Sterolibacterium sp.]
MKEQLHLLKPGDWLTLLLAVVCCALLLPLLWRGGAVQKAVIRSNGQIIAELAVNTARQYEVSGPLGITVIEIQPGRARVLSDPGPRQYCVRQGWLSRANAIAICAPNQVSLSLVGREPAYDSLSY